MFQIGHVSLTSADTYRRDSYCLVRVFQNLPAPPKQYGVFDVFRDFQSFFQLENSGSHLAMYPDDRFLPQGKQILPEICQVRPMPKPGSKPSLPVHDTFPDTSQIVVCKKSILLP